MIKIEEKNKKSCEPIAITDILFADMLPTLMVDHGIHEAYHLVLVVEVEGFVTGDLRHLADSCDVGLGAIFGGWGPCSNDLGDGCAVVVAYVTTKEYEASTHTIDHIDELLKVGVGGFTDFAQPDVADADIERIVVADAAGDWFFVHEEKKIKLCIELLQEISQLGVKVADFANYFAIVSATSQRG